MALRPFALLSFVALAGCSQRCEDTLVNTMPAPAGSAKALVITRDCGGNIGKTTRVVIAGAKPAAADQAVDALVLEGQVPLGVKWTSADAVEVTGIGSAVVLREEHAVDGVRVTYPK